MVLIAYANSEPQAHLRSLARVYTISTSSIELDDDFDQKSDI